MSDKRISMTFDTSAAPFVVRCFGLRVVDDKLKRPRAMDYEDVTCCQCNKVIETAEDVGGFFDTGEADQNVCCKSYICLLEAVEKQGK